MSRHLPLPALTLILGFSGATALAADTAAPAAESRETTAVAEKLAVGSNAPALAPARWFKGEPVTAFDKSKTYIIECWATWCGPCIAAIPHVNSLHHKFKDKGLVVIGVNVWDKDEAGAEKLVAEKGDGMAYRVAYDGAAASVANNWLKPAGAKGIPHAFVVRENKIIWQGHPATLEESTVADMIAGTFDPVKMQAELDAKMALMTKYRETQQKIGSLVMDQKYAEALALLESEKNTYETINPGEADYRFGEIHAKQGDATKALASLKIAAEKGKGSPVIHHRISQLLLSTPGVKDNAFALESAKKAAELGGNHPVLVLGFAQAQYGAGDKAGATTTLEKLASEAKGKSTRLEEAVATATEAVKTGAPWPTDLLSIKATRLKPGTPKATDEAKK